ncbi:MAG: alpha/beta hydrolase, partial [Rhodospirillaceae bacterium]
MVRAPHLLLAIICVGSVLPGAAETSGIRILTDVPYLEQGRTERLDLYLPASTTGTGQAVLWIHGGGWVSGDKAQAREKNIGQALAEWGCVVASVNYRMGDGAWPQNLLDCKNAVRFLRVHAAEYHLAPDRIAVAGGSAGGHLALMLAFTAGRQWEPAKPYPGVSNSVRAVLDFYGITNVLAWQKKDSAGRVTGQINQDAVRVIAGGEANNLAALRDASPVNQLSASSPPVLILLGLADTTVDHQQATELAAALQRVRVPHQILLLPGVGHTFNLDTWNQKPL